MPGNPGVCVVVIILRYTDIYLCIFMSLLMPSTLRCLSPRSVLRSCIPLLYPMVLTIWAGAYTEYLLSLPLFLALAARSTFNWIGVSEYH